MRNDTTFRLENPICKINHLAPRNKRIHIKINYIIKPPTSYSGFYADAAPMGTYYLYYSALYLAETQ